MSSVDVLPQTSEQPGDIEPSLVIDETPQPSPSNPETACRIIFSPDGTLHVAQCSSVNLPAGDNFDIAKHGPKIECLTLHTTDAPRRFKISEFSSATPSDSKFLFCLSCLRSYTDLAELTKHAVEEHSITDSTGFESNFLLCAPNPVNPNEHRLFYLEPVALLTPKAEASPAESSPTSKSNTPTTTSSAQVFSPTSVAGMLGGQLFTQDIARNLMIASELSANRILEKASQEAALQNLATRSTPDSQTPPQAPGRRSVCELHPEGKTAGVECPKCDMVLGSSRSLGGHMTMMHSRNSCKTLKCPKCNWHYKYQETLEIHMKEKHPNTEVTCPYCISNQPHPRLARGENYSCGYKPYRCEICKYSTTTKGNLSIHMQSDKHLNNVQEVQHGKTVADPTAILPCLGDSPSPNRLLPPISPPKNKPMFRCETCNYETTVARNLRIHQTSEKHLHNCFMLQQTFKHVAPNGGGEFAAAMSGMQVPLMLGEMPSSDVFLGGMAPGLVALGAEITVQSQLLQCCVCVAFECESFDELTRHIQRDRSQPAAGDILRTSDATGQTHICTLCNYKSTLKANFQLHTKTDKHLQKLQLVNHVREGGSKHEWRIKYLMNNSVQVRCNACNDYCNSLQKLQMHVGSLQHEVFTPSFAFIKSADFKEVDQCLKCRLCGYATQRRANMLIHLHSAQHGESVARSLQPFVSEPQTAVQIAAEWFCVEEVTVSTILDNQTPQKAPSSQKDSALASTQIDSKHNCNSCGGCFESESAVALHECPSLDSLTRVVRCPLCQLELSDKAELEQHLPQEHNVSKDAVPGLLAMLLPPNTESACTPSPSGSNDGAQQSTNGDHHCPMCEAQFNDVDSLFEHQKAENHLEKKQSPQGDISYLCWQKGCNQYFKSLQSVQMHYREIHAKRNPSSANAAPLIVSERHSHKFRCSQCAAAFRTDDQLREHQQYHKIRDSLKCLICSRSFRTHENLAKHLDQCHVTLNAPDHQKYKADTLRAAQLNGSASPALDMSSTASDRCDLCNESFPTKMSLQAHYATPAHQAKLTAQRKPYRCNVCSEAYTLAVDLEAHLRSPSHVSRINKVPMLIAKGEFDPFKPYCEIPELNNMNGAAAASTNPAVNPVQQAAFAQFQAQALMQMAMTKQQSSSTPLFPCDVCKQPFSSVDELRTHVTQGCSPPVVVNGASPELNGSADESALRQLQKSGAYSKLLEEYGYEVVQQYNESHQRKKRPAEDEKENDAEPVTKEPKMQEEVATPPVTNGDARTTETKKCEICAKEFSSIFVWKAHMEEVHKAYVALDAEVLESYSEEVKNVLNKRSTDEAPSTPNSTQAPPSAPATPKTSRPSRTTSRNHPATSTALPPDQAALFNQLAAMGNQAMANPAMAFGMAPYLGMGMPFMGAFGSPFLPGLFGPGMDPNVAALAASMAMTSGTSSSGIDPATILSVANNSAATTTSSSSSPPKHMAFPSAMAAIAAAAGSPMQPKRARTRITDEQQKVLREYFDINNSPTDEQVVEMSKKSGLPQKVIKHWFRNTLFKERQKSKDSPYNFSIPPTVGIDLEQYEKTGEANVYSLADPPNASAPAVTIKQELLPPEPMDSTAEASSAIVVTAPPNESDSKNGVAPDVGSQLLTSGATTPSSYPSTYPSAFPTPFPTFIKSELHSPPVPNVPSFDEQARNSLAAFQEMLQLSGLPPSSFAMTTSAHHTSPLSTHSSISPATAGLDMPMPARRANRTRFTDDQIRSLQAFFERNAYPKDDDLELLSKQLGLSPRVIVVWFQNQRQKARKVYENQPAALAQSTAAAAAAEQIYQCEKCKSMFQRHFELMKHQQSCPAVSPSPRTNGTLEVELDMKCVQCSMSFRDRSSFDDHMMSHLQSLGLDSSHSAMDLLADLAESSGRVTTETDISPSETDGTTPRRHRTPIAPEQLDILLQQYRLDTNPTGSKLDAIAAMTGLTKRSVQIWFQNARQRERRGQLPNNEPFNKRCPFCALLFHSKLTLEDHLMKKHASQCLQVKVDIDTLPSADEVPSIKMEEEEGGESQSDALRRLADMQSQLSVSTSNSTDLLSWLNAGRPEDRSISVFSGDDSRDGDSCDLFGQDSPSPGSSALMQANRNAQKRFRTHLTSMQIRVMKNIFTDYKTPSMSECDQLGSLLGLGKRVVQVWFQNARAKERKIKGGDPCKTPVPVSCRLCNVVYTSSLTVQEHLFGDQHIDTIKTFLIKTEGMKDSPKPSINPAVFERLQTAAGEQKGNMTTANLLANLALMNPGAFYGLPMIDPSVVGTDVSQLKIPANVQERITSALSGEACSVQFTQDGVGVEAVREGMEEGRECLEASNTQVGWGCKRCCKVFQDEAVFSQHQQTICQSTDPPFQLIQTKYNCSSCDVAVGTQAEFVDHMKSSQHHSKSASNTQ